MIQSSTVAELEVKAFASSSAKPPQSTGKSTSACRERDPPTKNGVCELPQTHSMAFVTPICSAMGSDNILRKQGGHVFRGCAGPWAPATRHSSLLTGSVATSPRSTQSALTASSAPWLNEVGSGGSVKRLPSSCTICYSLAQLEASRRWLLMQTTTTKRRCLSSCWKEPAWPHRHRESWAIALTT